jgi:hypothetical protein
VRRRGSFRAIADGCRLAVADAELGRVLEVGQQDDALTFATCDPDRLAMATDPDAYRDAFDFGAGMVDRQTGSGQWHLVTLMVFVCEGRLTFTRL